MGLALRGRAAFDTPRALAAAATGTLIACLLVSGVRAGELAEFLLYAVVFVAVPGSLCYRALRGPGGVVEQVVFGAALGQALVIVAFVGSAALGARGLLLAEPVLVSVAALAAMRRGSSERVARDEEAPRRFWLLVGLVCVAALAYVALASLPLIPLPRRADSVSYPLDLVFNLGIAGEALHHWPITDPHVAGEPLPYHMFSNIAVAALAQVTHVSLPTAFFRMFTLPLVALFVVELSLAGRLLGRSWWTGPIAAALFVFVGEIDLSRGTDLVFLNSMFQSLYGSPSFLLGLVMFVPLVVLIGRRLDGRPGTRGEWVLLGLFLVACAGAKASILPVVAVALVLYVAAGLWRSRGLDRSAVLVLALTVVAFLASYALLYSGGSSGLDLKLLGAIDKIQPARSLKASLGVPVLASALALALALIGLAGPALAGWVGLALDRPRRAPSRTFLVCLFLGGLAPWLVLDSFTANENWFLYVGYLAGCLLAAEGLGALWRARGRRHAAVALAAVAALGLVGAMDAPIDMSTGVGHLLRGETAYAVDTPYNRGMTRGLRAGLEWIERTTKPGDVVAVNNQYLSPGRRGPGYFYYSAFGERRVFLEGWGYSIRAVAAGADRVAHATVNPYSARQRLGDAVFAGADGRALRRLERVYEVRYLIVDRDHEGATPALARLGKRVYANRDVVIYRVGRASRT